MCDTNQKDKCECEHPELKPTNGKCSEELIQKCHGNTKEHPYHSEKK